MHQEYMLWNLVCNLFVFYKVYDHIDQIYKQIYTLQMLITVTASKK